MLYLVPTRYSVLLTLYEFVLHNSCLVYATKVQINVRSTFGEYSLGINRDNARHIIVLSNTVKSVSVILYTLFAIEALSGIEIEIQAAIVYDGNLANFVSMVKTL